MTIQKVLRVSGNSENEIVETATLLQNLLDKADTADVRKLLLTFQKKPHMLKTALKFC